VFGGPGTDPGKLAKKGTFRKYSRPLERVKNACNKPSMSRGQVLRERSERHRAKNRRKAGIAARRKKSPSKKKRRCKQEKESKESLLGEAIGHGGVERLVK